MKRLGLALPLLFVACGSVSRPCSEGGESPRDKLFRGTKQCVQTKDSYGRYLNNGTYVEWHPNGKRALEGEYKNGLKNGRWTEWDENGKVVSQKFYEDGAQVPLRDGAAPRGERGDAKSQGQVRSGM